MRLTELSPRWLSPDFFVFRVPTKPDRTNAWQACTRVVMSTKEQHALVEAAGMYPCDMQLCRPDSCWKFEPGAPFETLTVTPSIDGSAGGNWHGHITNGEIV